MKITTAEPTGPVHEDVVLTANQFNQITAQLNRIERMLVQSIPPSRRKAGLYSQSLANVEPHERKDELMRVFQRLGEMHHTKKMDQNFHPSIIQQGNHLVAPWMIVPISILLNRCSMLKSFRPAEAGDATDPKENAKKTLEACIAEGRLLETTVGALAGGLLGNGAAVVYPPDSLPEKLQRNLRGLLPEEPTEMQQRIAALNSETPEQKRARLIREYGEDYVKRMEDEDDSDEGLPPSADALPVPVAKPKLVWPKPAADDDSVEVPAAADDDEEDAAPMKIDTTPEIADVIIEDEPTSKKKKGKGGWTITA